MVEIKIVRASVNEIPDIVKLNSFVQELHFTQHPYIFKSTNNEAQTIEFFANIINQESNHLFVAYQKNTAVGYSWAALETKPGFALKHGRQQVYIHQIVVHDSHRKQGIGKALFQKIEKLANSENIDHYELDSWLFNTESHNFFKKIGFETYNIKMWRKSMKNT